MSADGLPPALARLIGQHPAAIREVRWPAQHPQNTPYLEVESKHGHVVLIEPGSGAVYALPPLPPGTEPDAVRQQRDLTAEAAVAFDGRPVIAAITPLPGADSTGWSLKFSTGAALALTPDGGLRVTSPDDAGA